MRIVTIIILILILLCVGYGLKAQVTGTITVHPDSIKNNGTIVRMEQVHTSLKPAKFVALGLSKELSKCNVCLKPFKKGERLVYICESVDDTYSNFQFVHASDSICKRVQPRYSPKRE